MLRQRVLPARLAGRTTVPLPGAGGGAVHPPRCRAAARGVLGADACGRAPGPRMGRWAAATRSSIRRRRFPSTGRTATRRSSRTRTGSCWRSSATPRSPPASRRRSTRPSTSTRSPDPVMASSPPCGSQTYRRKHASTGTRSCGDGVGGGGDGAARWIGSGTSRRRRHDHDERNCPGNANSAKVTIPFSVGATGLAPSTTAQLYVTDKDSNPEVTYGPATITADESGTVCLNILAAPAGMWKVDVVEQGSGFTDSKVFEIEGIDLPPVPTTIPTANPLAPVEPPPSASASASASTSADRTAAATPTTHGRSERADHHGRPDRADHDTPGDHHDGCVDDDRPDRDDDDDRSDHRAGPSSQPTVQVVALARGTGRRRSGVQTRTVADNRRFRNRNRTSSHRDVNGHCGPCLRAGRVGRGTAPRRPPWWSQTSVLTDPVRSPPRFPEQRAD